jgi:hypothetical protein
VCTGGGFGGGGLTAVIDPFGDLDEDGLSFDAKLKGSLGPVKVDLGAEFKPCDDYNDISDRFGIKPKAKACLGPACSNLTAKHTFGEKEEKPEKEGKGKTKAIKAGVSGKLAAKVCQQMQW